MSDYEPAAATVLDWLHSNLGGAALAPLTGSDTHALRAAVQSMKCSFEPGGSHIDHLELEQKEGEGESL